MRQLSSVAEDSGPGADRLGLRDGGRCLRRDARSGFGLPRGRVLAAVVLVGDLGHILPPGARVPTLLRP